MLGDQFNSFGGTRKALIGFPVNNETEDSFCYPAAGELPLNVAAAFADNKLFNLASELLVNILVVVNRVQHAPV